MMSVIPIKVTVPQQLTPENKCSFCRGTTCCTYFTQSIDTPRSMEDYDLLLWQLAHHETQVFMDEDGWFLLVNNRCRHLQDGGRCGIYETRPQICRDYSNSDCEFDGPSEPDDFDLFFPDYESLLAYCRKKFKGWERRFEPPAKAKKRRGRSVTA